jgi:hypothetical protein
MSQEFPVSHPPDVAVLFVHGIGNQSPGSHLLECVEPIIDFMSRLQKTAKTTSSIRVSAATLTPEAAEDAASSPAHVVVSTAQGQTWLLAESNWASAFPEPTYRVIVFWALRVIPVAIAMHAVGRLSESRDAVFHSAGALGLRDRVWAVLSLVAALILLFVNLLLVPVLVAAVIILLLVGLIPATPVRNGVLRAQRTLAGSAGDSYVFTDRPVLLAAIITKVRRDLDWLRGKAGGCPVALIAHSQGAAITHRLIRDDTQEAALFVTYGSGLRKLLTLEKAMIPVRVSAFLAAIGVVVLTWVMPSIVSDVRANAGPL